MTGGAGRAAAAMGASGTAADASAPPVPTRSNPRFRAVPSGQPGPPAAPTPAVPPAVEPEPPAPTGPAEPVEPAEPAEPVEPGQPAPGAAAALPAPPAGAPTQPLPAPDTPAAAERRPPPEAGSPDAPDPGRRARRGSGKRELRRLETRARIVDAATELFAERGFDAVSVVEVAARAGVVEKTVFNHFPVKEGLVFEADPPIRAALLDAVRQRPAGESVAAAAGGFLVRALTVLGSPEAADGVARMARIVRGSHTLQVREREILGDLTTALAGLIAGETGAVEGALEPWVAAHAVLGLYAALLELARDRVLAGTTGPALAEELATRGRRGLALLQFGLAGYGKRR